MNNRTRLQTMVRYFSIVKLRKMEYLRLIFTAILMWVNGVIYVYFLERSVFFLENSDIESFRNNIIYLLCYLFVHEVLNFATRRWWWVETETLWWGDIYNIYMRKYVSLNNNDVERIGVWKLVWIITQWTRTWVLTLSDTFMIWCAVIISFLYALYMISKISIWYSFAFLWVLWVALVFVLYINKLTHPYRVKRYNLRNTRLKNIVKILMSKNEILQWNRINDEIDVLYKNAETLKFVNQDMWIYRKLLKSTPQFVISLCICWFFYIWWIQVFEWTLELSAFVWITGMLILMQKSVQQAITFIHDLTKSFTDIEKMWDFFDNTPSLEGYDTGKEFDYKAWNIELENIWFAYDKWQTVFENFSLSLDWGKIYALVWNSGSGKSTLAKLIAGYLRHDSGELEIDGQNIKDISLKSYYQSIGYLTQEPSVFDGSVIDNLTYAVTWTVSDESLAEVIRLAKCEFIYDFKDGLETEIWEKWIRLSWGQRQRLAIAKIMLKDPQIVILDEPTSALDSFSEEQITQAMNNLFTGRTVIVIAHRLQTVKHADTIFVMENGKIVEQWNHTDLIKQNGTYNKMLELQSWF